MGQGVNPGTPRPRFFAERENNQQVFHHHILPNFLFIYALIMHQEQPRFEARSQFNA